MATASHLYENKTAARPACRKLRLFDVHQLQSALLVVDFPVSMLDLSLVKTNCRFPLN